MTPMSRIVASSLKKAKSGLAGLLIAAAAASGAHAASYTWTQATSGTFNWNDPANWSALPTSAADTQILIFANNTTSVASGLTLVSNNDLGTGEPGVFTLNVLTLNGKGPATAGPLPTITLQGADLAFSGTNPTLNFSAVSNVLIPSNYLMQWYLPVQYEIANNLQLNANTTFASVTTANPAPHLVPNKISGVISGAGNLTKTGSAAVWLSNTNTYTGATYITNGTLRADDGVGLPTNSSLIFNGRIGPGNIPAVGGIASVLQTSGRFTRAVGTGVGQVQWLDRTNGGFAATDSKLTVSLGALTLEDRGTPLVWDVTPGFMVDTGVSPTYGVLVLSSSSSNAETELTNDIDLRHSFVTNYRTRHFYVEDNPFSGNDFATMSGVISDSTGTLNNYNGITKVGTGMLRLTGVNTYKGETTVKNGMLDAIEGVGLPTESRLVLSGGVFQTNGTLTRTLATSGAGTIGWSGNAGLAARGGKLTVNLNPGNIVWGTTPGWAGFLMLNGVYTAANTTYSTADSEIEIQNNLDLNGGNRTVSVIDNPYSNGDFATISGVISGAMTINAANPSTSNGTLIKTGNGVLRLTAANTFTGMLDIGPGTLLLSSYGGAVEAIDGVGLPTSVYLRLSAGVFQSSGTFARQLSAISSDPAVAFPNGKVGWRTARGGGFSASTSKLTVRLNDDAVTPLQWSDTNVTNGMITFNANLQFGSFTSAAECEFQNAIVMGSKANDGTTLTPIRYIYVEDNTASTADFTTMSGVIAESDSANPVGLVKVGPGKLVLSANNTYTGATQVAGGMLAINGTPTGHGAFTVTPIAPQFGLAPGAALGGNGTISSNISLQGVDAINFAALAPGDGVGRLTVTGDITFGDYSRMLVEAAGATIDTLSVTGSISLNSATNTDALYLDGTFGSAAKYVIASYTGTRSGKFDAVYFNGVLVSNPESTAFGGYKLSYGAQTIDLVRAAVPGDANGDSKVDFADYLILESTYGSAPTSSIADADFDDNGVVEFADYLVLEANYGTDSSVPEPMTLTLLGLGALALLRRRN